MTGPSIDARIDPSPVRRPVSDDRGSTIPLILGFLVLAMLVVGGSITVGQAFVQQTDLQDVCDGAASAAAASSGDLDRGTAIASGTALPFTDVTGQVDDYLARDPSRANVRVSAMLTPDRRTLTLRCTQREPLALGRLFDRPTVQHVVTSSSRAAVTG